MKTRSVLIGAAGLAACAGLVFADDSCQNATPVTPGVYFGSTLSSTIDGSASCGDSDISPDEWYQFTAPEAGRLTVSLCGNGTDYDTVLSLHSDCGGTEIICNDDSCDLSSRVSYQMAQGELVKIRVAGFSGDVGNFEMNVSFTPGDGSVPNDTCAGAIPLQEGTNVFDNSDAQSDGPLETFCTEIYKDLWYTYVPSCTGTATFSLCNTSFDTVIALYDACNGTELACDDDSDDCGLQSILTAEVVSGRTYYFRVGGYDPEFEFGPGEIQVSCEGTGGCRADFNGDTQVDFFDYLDFASAFDSEDPSADFNADGQVDFFDYLDFVQAFSDCE